jgi:hypothetical protein
LKKEKNKDHRDGPSWNKVARFEQYYAADARRQQLLAADPELQVKVHRTGPDGCYFSVKTRVDPVIDKLRSKMRRGKK